VSLGLARTAQAGIAAALALAAVAIPGAPASAGRAGWVARTGRAGCVATAIPGRAGVTLPPATRSQEWWLGALHVIQAWASSRGAGVTVALLDTGVDAQQPDLAGSVITGPDYTGSGRRPGEPFWGVHGTEMASLIAGHGHGPGGCEGITGVAPAARILSVRVTLESGDPRLAQPAVAARLPGAIARGIRYAVSHGARVVDLPLDPAPVGGGSAAERSAVRHALARGAVLVAPAGDDGATTDAPEYPAASPGVIAVGAFGSAFVKAAFSSRQPYVTVTAAGARVTAATPTGYAEVNSTSAASAVVAGVVALIWARFPGLAPAQVTEALTGSTAYHPAGGRRDGPGDGTVDAAAALLAAARLAEAVPKAAASAHPEPAAPPVAPAVRSGHRSARTALIADAAIVTVVFLVLLAVILGGQMLRRRRPVRAGLGGDTARHHRKRALARRGRGVLAGEGPLPPAFAAPRPELAQAFLAAPAVPPPGTGTGGGGGQPAPAAGFPESAFARAGGAGSGLRRARVTSPGSAPGGAVGSPPPASRLEGTGTGKAAAGQGVASGPGAGAGLPPARRPQVSGSPPWGPAPRPASEFPWAQPAPLAAPGSRPLPARAEPAEPPAQRPRSWDEIAGEVWPGGPRAAARFPAPGSSAAAAARLPAPPAATGHGPPVFGPSAPPRPGRPIYVWHPGSGGPGSSSASWAGQPIRPPPVRGRPPWELGEGGKPAWQADEEPGAAMAARLPGEHDPGWPVLPRPRAPAPPSPAEDAPPAPGITPALGSTRAWGATPAPGISPGWAPFASAVGAEGEPTETLPAIPGAVPAGAAPEDAGSEPGGGTAAGEETEAFPVLPPGDGGRETTFLT
jgi:subtilisin family serine protease